MKRGNGADIAGRGGRVQASTMPRAVPRWAAWVWFAGCAAWVVDAAVSARFRAWAHAELALMVAMLFFAAGLFYRAQGRR